MPEGYQPTNHKNNRKLIIDNGFWTWVLDYFLFTYLIKDILNTFECKENSAIFGKTGNFKQYSIQNYVELESKYLLSSEMGNVLQDIEIIKDDVKTIKNDINNLMSAINNLTEAIKAKS
ncbi:hypothetical protein GLOIN_2v1791658 [Rhizophagus clarus]|uniref:Uncharacterized protein n=1 Tax=Rhizophagus clarus TaxID=94130 RepID=A0A8H3QHJ1_9GLOM|nr:hypothetical protein GLOIN_2v1791658 [Rhizophagus clarus]